MAVFAVRHPQLWCWGRFHFFGISCEISGGSKRQVISCLDRSFWWPSQCKMTLSRHWMGDDDRVGLRRWHGKSDERWCQSLQPLKLCHFRACQGPSLLNRKDMWSEKKTRRDLVKLHSHHPFQYSIGLLRWDANLRPARSECLTRQCKIRNLGNSGKLRGWGQQKMCTWYICKSLYVYCPCCL